MWTAEQVDNLRKSKTTCITSQVRSSYEHIRYVRYNQYCTSYIPEAAAHASRLQYVQAICIPPDPILMERPANKLPSRLLVNPPGSHAPLSSQTYNVLYLLQHTLVLRSSHEHIIYFKAPENTLTDSTLINSALINLYNGYKSKLIAYIPKQKWKFYLLHMSRQIVWLRFSKTSIHHSSIRELMCRSQTKRHRPKRLLLNGRCSAIYSHI